MGGNRAKMHVDRARHPRPTAHVDAPGICDINRTVGNLFDLLTLDHDHLGFGKFKRNPVENRPNLKHRYIRHSALLAIGCIGSARQ